MNSSVNQHTYIRTCTSTTRMLSVTDFPEILTVTISRCGDSVDPYWPHDHSVQTITELWRCGHQRPSKRYHDATMQKHHAL